MPEPEPRVQRKRTRTFRGCLTCRRRRVKCGEERPRCRNCIRLSLICRGYNISLQWRPVMTGDPNTFPANINPPSDRPRTDLFTLQQRISMIKCMGDCFSPLTLEDDLNDAIDRIENGAASIGPFGSFRVEEITSPAPSLDFPPLQSLPPIVPPVETDFLLNHYSNNLTHLLLPVPTAPSPWMTLFIPRCMSTLDRMNDPLGPGNIVSRSILFGILATAAFHVDSVFGHSNSSVDPNLTNTAGAAVSSSRWHEIGSRCRRIASTLVHATLVSIPTQHSEFDRSRELVLALLSLTASCLTGGLLFDMYSYLRLAVHLIQTAYHGGLDPAHDTSLVCIVTYLYSVAHMACLHIHLDEPKLPLSNDYTDDCDFIRKYLTNAQTQAKPHTPLFKPSDICDAALFSSLHGISISLVDLVAQTTQLHSLPQSQILSVSPIPAISQLENQIMTLSPPLSISQNPNIIQNHLVKAFHCTLILYFQRTLKRTHPYLLQCTARRTLAHLVRVEELKSADGIDAGFLWFSAYIAGCEAVDVKTDCDHEEGYNSESGRQQPRAHRLRTIAQDYLKRVQISGLGVAAQATRFMQAEWEGHDQSIANGGEA